jgi:hypothetical protein
MAQSAAPRSTPPQRIAARAFLLLAGLVLFGSIAGLFVFPEGEEQRSENQMQEDRARVERVAPAVRPPKEGPLDTTPWYRREERSRLP